MENIDKLKVLIQAELNLCNSDNTPTVCRMSSDPEQYPNLERMIIDRIKNNGFSIGQAITDIERQYNINMIED